MFNNDEDNVYNDTIYGVPDEDRVSRVGLGWGGLFMLLLMVCFVGSVAWVYMATYGVGIYYHVDFDEWAVEEMSDGDAKLITDPIRVRKIWGSKIYYYPRIYNAKFNDADSIVVTFNDGVQAQMGVMTRLQLIDDDKRVMYALSTCLTCSRSSARTPRRPSAGR